jgi:hypothetical protein
MFLRPNLRHKDGKDHTYWSLVETVRTPDGPRQRTLCYLGELNDSAQARWLKTIEVFNAQGESQQLKLFPSDVAPPEGDASVARVRLDQVRLERTRRFGGLSVQMPPNHLTASRIGGLKAPGQGSQSGVYCTCEYGAQMAAIPTSRRWLTKGPRASRRRVCIGRNGLIG